MAPSETRAESGTATFEGPTSCEALTTRGHRPCRARVAYAVDVPGCGPRRLCGPHLRHVRIHGALPEPRPPKPTREPEPPRVLVRPTWSDEEDALLLAHAGEPTKAVAPLFPGRTVPAIHQRRATLRRRS